MGRRRNPEPVQQSAELLAILRQVDGSCRGAEDRYSPARQLRGEGERGLPPELDDDAHRLLGLADGQHVLQGHRVEVQSVARVVVRRDGLGVRVHHDGLIPGVVQRERRVDARVVELDALTDAVGPRAENDDPRPLPGPDLGLLLVGRVVIGRLCGELACARIHGLVHGKDAEAPPCLPDVPLGGTHEQRDALIGQPALLCCAQRIERHIVDPPTPQPLGRLLD